MTTERFDTQKRKIYRMLDPIFGGLFSLLIVMTLVGIHRGELAWEGILGPLIYTVTNILLSQAGLRTSWIDRVDYFRLLFGPMFFFSHAWLEKGILPVWLYYLITSLGFSSNRYFYSQDRFRAYAVALYWAGGYALHATFWKLHGEWEEQMLHFAFIVSTSVVMIEITALLSHAYLSERAAKAQAFGASKLSALGEMAGGIAHEINDPLAIIKTTASQMREMLEDPELDKELLAGMTRTIEDSTERMARIVDGMRVVARQGSNDPLRPLGVRELVDQTLGLCRERLKSRGIQLQVDPSLGELRFDGRLVEMSQVLLNLLNNACDAARGTEKPWIRISAQDAGANVELRVDDGGPGVPASLREQIFEPFFTTKEKGIGLGLSVSRGILRAQGGDLRLDASRGCSSFVIRMPKIQIEKGAA